MSAKKISSIDPLVRLDSRQANLELSADSVFVHKSGIEFRSPTPFHEWAEMTVALSSPRDGSKIQCAGVVIACSGSKHTGYHISLVFTNVSKHAQERLNSMAHSDLGAS